MVVGYGEAVRLAQQSNSMPYSPILIIREIREIKEFREIREVREFRERVWYTPA